MNLLESCSNSKKLLENILSCMRNSIIITDLEGIVLFTNSVVEEMFGFTSEELKGGKLSLIFTPEDLTFLYPNLIHMARKEKAFEGKVMVNRRDKTRFLSFIVFRAYFDPVQNKTFIFVCIQEIYKKEYSKNFRETRDDDLVKIANGIAHELRNPLVGIGGFAKRLYQSCKTSDNHEKYYTYIINNLKKIEGLVKKVEFFAALPKPSFTKESPDDLIKKALQPYLQQIEKRGIDLSINIKEIVMIVDKHLFTKAFSIIVENALDALLDGGRIVIHSGTNDTQYELRVTDSGSGISPEDIPYIFDPFFSTKPDGAGIDLAIVKRIMVSHGGKVEVTSKHGEGTTFVLLFPLERRRTIRISCLED
ncbi:MAG TPA: hypothetical protein DDW42_04140 [Desulfobacteraceae bacterium]|nr:hypothetical protein [Desulfobacteraceae bacterium]